MSLLSFPLLAETKCDSALRLAEYALDAKLANAATQAENRLMELDYESTPERADEAGVAGYIKPLVTIIKSEPQIEYRRPLDMPYQISRSGDEVFVLRTYALNATQHQIEAQKQLWYKIRYIERPDQIVAELYLLQGNSETKVGQYEMSKTSIETLRRSGKKEFSLGSPGISYQLDEKAYEDLNLPAGFIGQLRIDLYQIVIEAFLHPHRKAI